MLIILMVGILLSVWFAWQHQNNTQQKIMMEFKTAAQERIRLISDKIDHNNIVLRSVSAFFRSSNDVTREEFSIYTSQLLKDYPYIYAVEWIPRVEGPERTAYEKNSGLPNFEFIQENDNQEMVRATERNEYFPVYFIEPYDNGNTKVLGFDLASDTERNKALKHARESRQIASTSRVELLQSDQKAIGVIFYEPVIQKIKDAQGKQYEHITGFTGSVVPLAAMIEAALKPLNYAGVNIIIHDLSADSEEHKLLYMRSTRLKDIPDEDMLEDFQNPGLLVERTTLDVGGRKWQVTILPTRGYFEMNVHGIVYAMLFGGWVFTLLLVFYIYSRIRENERITQEVEERTRQLSKAKRETEMILLSTQEGVTGLDQDGNITFCNPTSSQLLGYSKKELIGKNHHQLLHFKHPDGSDYSSESCPIQQILEYGRPCNVRDEVFWKRNGESVQIEYTGSPILEGGDITGAVLVFRDIAERRALEQKLEQMARYDQLTGLANRTLFAEHLKNSLTRAERSGRKVAILYLDLNGFKPINDKLGHAAGDFLLKSFANTLRNISRDSDTVARMGGDEFTILADNLENEQECIIIVQRLKKALQTPFEIEGHLFNIGASVGIAFYPDHTKDADNLIICADAAMYQAKRDKSLDYVIFDPEKKS